MKVALALSVLLAGCATAGPYAPVRETRFAALGQQPFWMVTIGDDRIVFRSAAEAAGVDRRDERVFPRTLPRTVGGVVTWHSQAGTDTITIESSPGPCANGRSQQFERRVTVRMNETVFSGCGGPPVADAR
jgi:uncharacterized membrane protein